MVLDGHEASVTSVVASPDENYILSGSMDKTIRIWDANTGQETSVHHTENKVLSVGYSPDGFMIVGVEERNREVQIRDVQSGKELLVLRATKDDSINSVSFSPKGDYIVGGTGCFEQFILESDCAVVIWEAKSGRQHAVLRGHTNQVRCVSYSPDEGRIVSGSDDMTVRIWETIREHQLRWTPLLRQHEG